MIDNTLAAVSADSLSIFLSGEKNFRYDIYPEYKANRTAPKPRHLKDLKNYLVEKYQAQVADGCEADDLLGIEQCSYQGRIAESETIICSLDKDLKMIPGNHYSFEISGKGWVKPAERVFVEYFQGIKHFYMQMLVGDTADNIKGAKGIGKVKAERLLADCTTEQELFETVESQYGSLEELEMTGKCLWIWRKPGDVWSIPTFETTEVKKNLSKQQ